MDPTEDLGLQRVEAARYALLRRLTLAMRHQMVVHLQPIGMVTRRMERSLRGPSPDMVVLGHDMVQVQDFAKAGVGASLDFVTWLAPEPGTEVALDAGVEQCAQLLRTHFSFRGYTLRNEVAGAPQPVKRAALRMLLPAVLFGVTDEAVSPADLVVSSPAGDDRQLLVDVRAVTGAPGFEPPAPYRLLEWQEVQHLAQHEGVKLTRSASGASLRWSA